MTPTYLLECTGCEFQTSVEGSFVVATTAVGEHRTAAAAGPTEHFVNVRRLGASPPVE